MRSDEAEVDWNEGSDEDGCGRLRSHLFRDDCEWSTGSRVVPLRNKSSSSEIETPAVYSEPHTFELSSLSKPLHALRLKA